MHRGAETVAGCPAIENDVTRLLAAKCSFHPTHTFVDITVADSSLLNVNAEALHGAAETQVGHDRADNDVVAQVAAVLQLLGEDSHENITVGSDPVLVDSNQPISISVKCKTDTSVDERRYVLRHRCAAAGIDIVAIGLCGMDLDGGTEPFKQLGGSLVGSAVGAVENKLEATQAVVGVLGKVLDIAVYSVRHLAPDPDQRPVRVLPRSTAPVPSLDDRLLLVVELAPGWPNELDAIVVGRIV